MQPSYVPVTAYVKATPLQRFIAAFIDGIIGNLAVWLLMIVSYNLITVGYIITIGYLLTKDALPEMGGYLGGQSIGKKLMGIKVIKEDTGGSLVGDYGTAITRQVSLLIPFFNIIDALMVFSADSKRFGDKWAKTIVIKA
ncbi:RDD family protein [Spirosoma jeollabukense]